MPVAFLRYRECETRMNEFRRKTSRLAIIGGTGLTRLPDLEIQRREVVHTPYGEPSGPMIFGLYHHHEVVFLPRHGAHHTIPPHRINYRANIWALRQVGADTVLAIAAVGGITAEMQPARLVIPDQVIDYTTDRLSTFFDGDDAAGVQHVDMTEPYAEDVRQCLIDAGRAHPELELVDRGTYGATQGPRLETAAEITRMERDGCHLVGMTGMPEATLARELDLRYACCAVVANWAAGRSGHASITMEEINRNLDAGLADVRRLLPGFMDRLFAI
jgi:5'-methylthioinosine phosphorylase